MNQLGSERGSVAQGFRQQNINFSSAGAALTLFNGVSKTLLPQSLTAQPPFDQSNVQGQVLRMLELEETMVLKLPDQNRVNTPCFGDVLRRIIYVDHQRNGSPTTAAASDVINVAPGTADVTNFTLIDNVDRFTIVDDRNYDINVNAMTVAIATQSVASGPASISLTGTTTSNSGVFPTYNQLGGTFPTYNGVESTGSVTGTFPNYQPDFSPNTAQPTAPTGGFLGNSITNNTTATATISQTSRNHPAYQIITPNMMQDSSGVFPLNNNTDTPTGGVFPDYTPSGGVFPNSTTANTGTITYPTWSNDITTALFNNATTYKTVHNKFDLREFAHTVYAPRAAGPAQPQIPISNDLQVMWISKEGLVQLETTYRLWYKMK